MKKALCLLMSLLLAAGMLAACGGGASPDSAVPSDPTVSSDPTEQIAPTAASESVGVITDEMRAALKTQFEEVFTQRLFQGAAYVVYQGEEVYAGGVGPAIKAEKLENGVNVVYQIASITKQFTAAAILRLCEEGRLSLDDTLEKYFPDYKAGKDITIHSMLSMQSGIPDYLRSYDENGDQTNSTSTPYVEGISDDNTPEENKAALERYILAQDILFEQGDRYSYSNSNYFLLGKIIEQVSGVDYHTYIRTNFFEPLGMDTAGFIGDYDHTGVTVAKGYRGGNATNWLSYTGAAFACGDIMASPIDLYKWSIALHNGRVLSDEMYKKMTAPYIYDKQTGTAYGYGLMIRQNIGAVIYYHSGSIPGFMSAVCYIPGQDYFIALISNHADEGTMSIAAKLTEIFTEKLKENLNS